MTSSPKDRPNDSQSPDEHFDSVAALRHLAHALEQTADIHEKAQNLHAHAAREAASMTHRVLEDLLSRSPATPASSAAIEGQFAGVERHLVDVSTRLGRLERLIEGGLPRSTLQPADAARAPEASGEVSLSDWERAILGDELAGQPGLAFQRSQLLSGVIEGNAAARALAGQLLVFRAAPAERLPPLLKEIGEAYYRWQPKARPGNSPFEESLAAWLQRTCEAAGLHNTIELVHPGERFDSARHNASSRGVEIAEVLGWVVLRDNGKVYTKATVAVR